jgi:hypothetical protein
MRIKTNREREARKLRNKAKRNIASVQKDAFKAIKAVVNAQTELDRIAKEAGLTEEEMTELKKGGNDGNSEEEAKDC